MKKKIETYTPNMRQAEAHGANERYILYGGAYGGGKTTWLVNQAIKLSWLYPGNRGFLCCRQLVDFKDNGLQQLVQYLPEELYSVARGGVWHQTDHYFRLYNGSVIMYGGLGNEVEAVRTISNMPELGWFGIDQAEQVSEQQFLLLCGRLRLNIPGMVFKGLLTANPHPGWLRDRFIENCLPDHKFVQALPKDNAEHLPADYEARLREQYTPEMAKRLLEGNWDVDLSGDHLVPYEFIRGAVDKKVEVKGDLVAGVDISRMGGDETVFILRQGDMVKHIEAWSHHDTQYSAGRIGRLIREKKPVVTFVDSVGVGAGVFDPLKAEGFPVEEVNVGEKAFDSEMYLNRRAEYYNLLAKKFREGTISIPDDAKLTSQLAAIKYDYRNTRMFIRDKESLRASLGCSPDYADALMLCFIPLPESAKTMRAHVQYV